MLLREADALGAEPIDHPVVDRDQIVDFGLPDRKESRRELFVANQAQPLGRKPQLRIQVARESPSDKQRDGEGGFDREQPERIVPEQVNAEGREHPVDHDEVGDGTPPEGHTVISYFSKRR